MLWLLLLRAGARRSSTGVPLRTGERVEDRPAGARTMRALVAVHGWTANEARNPLAQSAGRSPRTGPLGCPSLGLPSLGQAREGDRPAGMRDEPAGTWTGVREAAGSV